MFIGTFNSDVRAFFAKVAPAFAGRTCVIGCSGNFTMEAILTATTKPRAIFSNDVSLYSSLAGAFLTGGDLPLTVKDSAFSWLDPFLKTPLSKLASVMVLLNMLDFEKQKNTHQKRMWNIYLTAFTSLVEKTMGKVSLATIRVDSYFAGDVVDHFKAHPETDAIYACYAPTYSGGYELLYKRLEQIIGWPSPSYSLLNDEARDKLLDWMKERSFFWADDREIPGLKPVLIQHSGRARTVYIYSNLDMRSAYMIDPVIPPLPKFRLFGPKTVINPESQIQLIRIKTNLLARYKNAYLGKNIVFSAGSWAFMAVIDGLVAGFIEFSRGKYNAVEMYLNSDFVISGTGYKRLSKLMPMLAIAGETRDALQRLNQIRLTNVVTTAFTERAVSMKYRGVLELVKRGKDANGHQFLNYAGDFNELSWKETLDLWLTKHALTD